MGSNDSEGRKGKGESYQFILHKYVKRSYGIYYPYKLSNEV